MSDFLPNALKVIEHYQQGLLNGLNEQMNGSLPLRMFVAEKAQSSKPKLHPIVILTAWNESNTLVFNYAS